MRCAKGHCWWYIGCLSNLSSVLKLMCRRWTGQRSQRWTWQYWRYSLRGKIILRMMNRWNPWWQRGSSSIVHTTTQTTGKTVMARIASLYTGTVETMPGSIAFTTSNNFIHCLPFYSSLINSSDCFSASHYFTIMHWNIAPLSPKAWSQMNTILRGGVKAVFSQSLGFTGTCQYPLANLIGSSRRKTNTSILFCNNDLWQCPLICWLLNDSICLHLFQFLINLLPIGIRYSVWLLLNWGVDGSHDLMGLLVLSGISLTTRIFAVQKAPLISFNSFSFLYSNIHLYTFPPSA